MNYLGVKVDFNQGLDARLIDAGIARLLSKVKWLTPLRLACDSTEMMPIIQKAVTLLRWENVTPRRYYCYVMFQDINEAKERMKAEFNSRTWEEYAKDKLVTA